jgi:hypothetical protein
MHAGSGRLGVAERYDSHVLAVQHRNSGQWGLLHLHGRVATIILDAAWACPFSPSSWKAFSEGHSQWLRRTYSAWQLITQEEGAAWVANGQPQHGPDYRPPE